MKESESKLARNEVKLGNDKNEVEEKEQREGWREGEDKGDVRRGIVGEEGEEEEEA